MSKRITKNKEKNKEEDINLNGSTGLLQLALEALPHAVIVFKIIDDVPKNLYDFELYAWNASASEMTGFLPEKVIGEKILSLFPAAAGNALLDNLNKAVSNNESAEWEYVHKNEWLRNTAIRKGDFLFMTTENITRYKRSEQKIQELNLQLLHKNRELASLHSELATFNNIAANDYKETLRKLYTIMEFIVTNDAHNLSNEGKANIRRGQSAIQKMKLLTEDMLSYSSLHGLETEKAEVDLNEMIAIIAEDLKKTHKEINLGLECDHLPKIQGYPSLISLLFHHILTNAIKFKKEENNVHILIQCTQVNGLLINHAAASPELWYTLISITDHGIGFAQEDAKKIFGMFQRLHDKTKYRGSGIGLAICNKIMDIHEGFITAESEINKGATFNCYFPVL